MYEVLKTEFSNRSRSYKALIEMEIIHYFIDFIRDNPELTPIKDETAIIRAASIRQSITLPTTFLITTQNPSL